MCHLILLMPVLGLSVFWLLPLSFATPVYIVIALVSAFLYWLIMRAMRRPMQDGFQSLIGAEAKVVSKLPGLSTRYLVRARGKGELWSTCSTDVLDIGEWVNIVATKGIGVVVERMDNPHDELGNVKKRVGAEIAEINERHCH